MSARGHVNNTFYTAEPMLISSRLDVLEAVPAAAGWLAQFLQGSISTTLALLAVAGLGLAMLLGYMPVRRGASVVLGCFILFGASAIANGLLALARSHETVAPEVAPPPTPMPLPTAPRPDPDPYAGASVPM